MYYKKYKVKKLERLFWGRYLEEQHFTRKNWNYQNISYQPKHKFLKKLVNKRLRKIETYNGNHYKKVNEYHYIIN